MKRNIAQLARTLSVVFVFLVFSYIFGALFSGLNDYCEDKDKKCISFKPLPISIPTDATASLLGASSGAIFTFLAFYLLEKVKESAAPKARLKISFSPDEKEELVVNSNPHYIFNPETRRHIEFGRAHYLRIKVTNEGDKIADGCRGYLKDLQKTSSNSKTFNRLAGSEGSMRLLWSYEKRGDYRSGAAEQIPSGASDYLDILVSYDDALKPSRLGNDKDTWFLKLKTQLQPLKYAKFIEINSYSDVAYKLNVEVCANECTPVSISLVLMYSAGTSVIEVYPENSSGRRIIFNLCPSSTPSPSIPVGITADDLYDLL
jgi:hypothetical protein